MRNLVISAVLPLALVLAGEAQAQAIFNTPDGPVMFRPHIGRAQPAPMPVAAPAVVPAQAPVAMVAAPPPSRGRTRPAGPPSPEAAAPIQAGHYGGGFIEILMTGRDPGPGIRPAYPRQNLAALPGTPDGQEDVGIRRVVDPRFQRQVVDYDGRHGPGTIIIDTPNKFLYLVQDGRKALRYGIGVGRPGFSWAGMKTVTMKREWPDWRPPAEMLKRRPDLPRFMAGGPANPLGARALYLGSSLYRIHGTNEPWTIGEAVSSGCIRMMNEDVVDLYERARVGTKVLVI
jgi:lipoprotein-anchoring transpeptidase ErfK/SrfK